jgi:hypothetical protein
MDPWDEVRWGFLNSAGLKMWLSLLTGGGVEYSELQDVREWLQGAKEGDTCHLNTDDWKIVPQEKGEIEIHCNWV